MKLLLLCSSYDYDFLDAFRRLPALQGVQIAKSETSYSNPVTLDAVCDKYKIDAVVCAQQSTMQAILADSPDWTKPEGKKAITLNMFAGSLLHLRSGREVLIVDSLLRLLTVPYEKFVCDRFVSKLTKPAKWFKQTEFKWQLVTNENFKQALQTIADSTICGIDIETPWPQHGPRYITCVSYTCYLAAEHRTISYVIQVDSQFALDFVTAANASPSRKVFQNGLYDNTYFMRWNCPVSNWLFDTYHLFHSWQSELPKSLDFVALFSLRKIRYWKDDHKTGNLVDLHRYCAYDSWATVNSLLALMELMPQWAVDNYVQHEFPMVFPALTTALEGLDCDVERFQSTANQKEDEVAAAKKRLQYLLSEPNYNPASPKQNKEVFRLVGAKDVESTGKIATLYAKTLNPLAAFLLEELENYKKLAKQVSTYFTPEKLWHNRIYYSLNPGGTDTLRLASSESAFDCGWQIQNIPNSDDSFKQCVIAPPGWYIAEIDKKQAEARCVGYLAGDQSLINLVESTHDYHSWNASAFFGISYESIFDEETGKTLNKKMRDLAKRVNHGANYNMGEQTLLDTMGPKLTSEAKMLLKLPANMSLLRVCRFLLQRYSATYSQVKTRWYQQIIATIEVEKKLTSALGWVRYFHGSPKRNKHNLNAAIAHAPQNLSVAIINKEWHAIWLETIYGSLRNKVRIKAQIHDSLLFIYKQPEDAKAVQDMMNLRVPVKGSDSVTRTLFIPTDLSLGKQPATRWSELK